MSMAHTSDEIAAPVEKGLRRGAIGLLSSVVIAVSSTAPAYSMAASLGLIVAVIGVHSPGMLVAAFVLSMNSAPGMLSYVSAP